VPALISDQFRKSVFGLLAYRQHQAVLRARPGELADVGVDLLNFAAEVDGLPEESALHARVGVG
jgi:hypothetical protein